MKILFILLMMIVVVQLGTAAAASAQVTPGEPDPLAATRSIGDVISDAGGKPVHVIYVHGMRAEGPGATRPFLKKLGKHVGRKEGPFAAERRYVDLKGWPQEARVGLDPVWNSQTEWEASRPFVDRYVVKGARGETVIVDEVNWWPLLFPLKCRFLLLPEHILAGADEAHLRMCARNYPPYHPWITPEQVEEILSRKPLSGGGVKLNRALKHQIMNWGLSDAVIALGPMGAYINEALDHAFSMAEAAPEKSGEAEYIVISESLGSFVVLDAFRKKKGAVNSVLAKTHNLYFLANQFALLELGRVEGLPPIVSTREKIAPTAEVAPEPASTSPLAGLRRWAQADEKLTDTGRGVRQVIAFSDPSDVLTYRLPEIDGALVANVYVRNGSSFLGLAAHPVRAHAGHMQNPRVIEAMLRKTRE